MQSRGYRDVELGREAGDWNPGCSKTSLLICRKKMIDWILDLVAFRQSFLFRAIMYSMAVNFAFLILLLENVYV